LRLLLVCLGTHGIVAHPWGANSVWILALAQHCTHHGGIVGIRNAEPLQSTENFRTWCRPASGGTGQILVEHTLGVPFGPQSRPDLVLRHTAGLNALADLPS
jgi:hypothetical protein